MLGRIRSRWDLGEALPFGFVSLGPLLLFAPMLVRGQVLFWGTPLLQFTPWRAFALQALRGGHLPLWNPLLGMGAPLLANYQVALFYPPNWLLALVGIAWGQGLLVTLHLIWAGCGVVVLGRRLGFSRLGQGLAGLAFSLSGYMVARAEFLSILTATAWVPWLIVAADRLAQAAAAERPELRDLGKAIMGMSLALAMQWLAGHAQVSLYSLVIVALWAVWQAARQGGLRSWLRLMPSMLVAGLLASAVSAVQLLPTLEYVVNSHRAGALDPDFAFSYSFWPWRLLGLLAPSLFGTPAQGSFWGYGNFWEDAIYIGVLGLVLAIAALVRGLRSKGFQRELAIFLLVVIVCSFTLALGRNTPVFPWLFSHVPTFDLFQAPARWNLLLVFGLALLAGMGAKEWGELTPRGRYWSRLGALGAVVLAVAPWLVWFAIPKLGVDSIRALSMAGALLFIAILLRLWRPSPPRKGWDALIGLVLLIDLWFAGLGLNPATGNTLYQGKSLLADQVTSGHRLYMPKDLEDELKFERYFRFDTFTPGEDWRGVRDAGLPNTILLDGLSSANNFDPLIPSRYEQWMDTLEALPGAEQQRLLALMDVAWLAVRDPQTIVRYEPVAGAMRLRLVANAEWVESGEAALSRVASAGLDYSKTVVLEGAQPANTRQSMEGGVVQLRETSDPDTVWADVSSPDGGWLVLSDVWYPGWRAWIDEQETDIVRADYLFRAVWVPGGEHVVTFRYQPFSFYLGSALSVLGCLLMVVMAWRWRRE